MLKKRLIGIAFIFTTLLTSLSLTNEFESKPIDTETTAQSSRVYVCGGEYATKFHSHSNCRGLNNCKGGIYYYSSQQAAKNAGYSYCSICWR